MTVPLCLSEVHAQRQTLAVAKVTFPDSRFRPFAGCSGCVTWMFREALAEGRPILIEPIAGAYGDCPVCGGRVRLRPSGLIAAHQGSSYRTCDGRGQKPQDGGEDRG